MKTKIIFLRHAQTKKDPKAHASSWSLTVEGLKEAQQIAQNTDFSNLDVIYISEEPKTLLTIQPLLKKNNKRDFKMIRNTDIIKIL